MQCSQPTRPVPCPRDPRRPMYRASTGERGPGPGPAARITGAPPGGGGRAGAPAPPPPPPLRLLARAQRRAPLHVEKALEFFEGFVADPLPLAQTPPPFNPAELAPPRDHSLGLR